MAVARGERRKRNTTSTTSTSVSSSVSSTSRTPSRMVCERSYMTAMVMPAGTLARSLGSSALTLSATSTVLVPGWRWMASVIERRSGWSVSGAPNHEAVLSFCTLSTTVATSRSRIGAPLRYVTTRLPNSAASLSWPLACTTYCRLAP